MVFVIAFIVILVQANARLIEAQILNRTSTEPLRNDSSDDECRVPPTFRTPPDFRSGNVRISVAKCKEYLWQSNKRQEEIKYKVKCSEADVALTDIYFIIGGEPAYPGEFPHMGAIGWQGVTDEWVFLCGGSLISPNYMLTAAHCSEASLDTRLNDTIPKIVRLGYNNIAKLNPKYSQIDAKIKRIIKHPEYKSPMKYNDIALIELDIEFKFTNLLQPACLWSKPNFDGLKNKVSITGWGATEEKGASGVKDLLVGTVDIIDSITCDNLLKSRRSRLFKGLKDHQMCAGTPKGLVDTCQGDSGGPLQSEIDVSIEFEIESSMYYVLGVTSFGFGCGRAELPGVYTKVYNFLDWIESIVWT